MRRTAFAAIAALLGLAMAPAAQATILTANGIQSASSDVTVPGSATLVAHQTLTGSSGAGGTGLSVSVLEDVYKQTNGNIDFTYTITNTSATGSGHSIDSVTAGNFSALGTSTINVGGAGLTTAATAPVNVSWSSDGSAVKWFFSDGVNHDIGIGKTSQTLVILTSAKTYENLGSLTVQNTATVNLGGFQPAPEPSTLAIAGLGALGMIGYGLRRRKALGV